MDKSDLKKLIKPLMKECIQEVLIEHGLMSLIAEQKTVKNDTPEEKFIKSVKSEQKPQVSEARKVMLESIGRSGYMNNKFDPFSGTKPLTESQAGDAAKPNSPVASANLDDPGIDISSLMGNTGKWKAIVGGKGK